MKSDTFRTAQMFRQVRSTLKKPSSRNLLATLDRMPATLTVEKPWAWMLLANANRNTERQSRKLRPS
ncbi:MAG: hypothetical protein BWX88_03459 [Planctomycetes bacterium ADurb.Bin126]|nr:MAG: hypothetical protein BWX88_03459 [Planctomycetes bacterium ADurb.Bin126]